MDNPVHILCTRPINEQLVETARLKNIEIDTLSFIDTQPVETVEIQQEIENSLLLSTSVVFTSMNAVEAVARFMENEYPDWRIFCIGQTTRQLVVKYFGEELIAGSADNAGELAEVVAEQNEGEEVIFFCGDQRRGELPAILRGHEVDVNEIIVYETILVPHKINIPYLGILFFSPSAVESFFSVNKGVKETVYFAIGKTTAEAILKRGEYKVIVGDSVGKDNLVEKMLEYFGVD